MVSTGERRDEYEHSLSLTLARIAWRSVIMKTFFTISGGILLALSFVATSDARQHANGEGPTQSEPSSYNPDYGSQTNTRNWDNSCLHSVPVMYWCSSDGG